jgi:hypothetical protein
MILTAVTSLAGRAVIKDYFALHSERVIVAGLPEVLAFFARAAFRLHFRDTRDGFGSKNHSDDVDCPLHLTRCLQSPPLWKLEVRSRG